MTQIGRTMPWIGRTTIRAEGKVEMPTSLRALMRVLCTVCAVLSLIVALVFASALFSSTMTEDLRYEFVLVFGVAWIVFTAMVSILIHDS